MEQELGSVLDCFGNEVRRMTSRFAAVDGSQFAQVPAKDSEVDPVYTLGDQLFVEPQPLALPSRIDLDSPIMMSRAEVAIARSHIKVWREIAAGSCEHVLVLEDDIWIRPGFAKHIDDAWSELSVRCQGPSMCDLLYVSYEEVVGGAPKSFVSPNVFRPARGLWHLSGYVLSRAGARKLLSLLPCRGPVDLWVNHQFQKMDVIATKRAIVSQRPDMQSTNSYSILPSLTRIGAISSERAALFSIRPLEKPVFAFGPQGSGLSSLAMALSMLGYRCCSDLLDIPIGEKEKLLAGRGNRIFDAYVNIGSLSNHVHTLRRRYPGARFFVTAAGGSDANTDSEWTNGDAVGADTVILYSSEQTKWKKVCEHLRCAPPGCEFPEIADLGKRELVCRTEVGNDIPTARKARQDRSPWVIESRKRWDGIHLANCSELASNREPPNSIVDSLDELEPSKWKLRSDTFDGNLGLFRPNNIKVIAGRGIVLNVRREALGVRSYSAASLTSRIRFLYGRFEAVIRASNVPGVVTGFFLHRNSPRQEIDIEIAGNRPDRLVVNVFFNPGTAGSEYDYGYRGAPSVIDLGFDSSESDHLYTIEWSPSEIRWSVDKQVVHRRVEWNPTPIPHLPMHLHANLWPTASTELAGRLAVRKLPATSFVRTINVESYLCDEAIGE